MALKACRECGKEVSTEADKCPHCGVGDPTWSIRNDRTKRGKAWAAFLSFAVVVFGVARFLDSNSAQHSEGQADIQRPEALSPSVKASPSPSCASDWRLCKDNTDFVENNLFGWGRVKGECKEAAETKSKFGTPEWPWLAFHSYIGGDSIHNTGTIFVSEDDAKFSNAFGAMEKVSVECVYDLKGSMVKEAIIIQR
jgi:hypothetical protein